MRSSDEVDETAGLPDGGGAEPRARDAEAPGARAAGGPFAEPWLLAAGLCLLAAAACLWLGLFDGAFVAAALGTVCWFLNVRSKLPPRRREAEAEEDDEPPAEDEE